ncbi:MAG: EpsI family protein [Pseudomonadales bacterium]|nr:EpsI family protein [Pseudomonadales bacterium]
MTVVDSTQATSRHARVIGAIALAVVAWGLAYHTSILSIAAQWSENGTYSHGFLSFALAAYIVYREFDRISLTPRFSWITLGLLLGAVAGWWMGDIANVQKIAQLGTFVMLALALIALCGWRVVATLEYPLLILFLVIPVWDFLQGPLQDLSTVVAAATVKALGIPLLLEGHQITMPGGRFVVEEACSGLGFFLCAITLGVFYTYLNGLTRREGLLLIGISAATAIVANWVRIISILLVGDEFGMDHPIVADHLTFGWVVFAIALVPLFFVSHRFFPPHPPALHEPSADSQLNIPVLVTVLAILSIGPGLGLWVQYGSGSRTPVALPDGVSDVVRERGRADWYPDFPGADQVLSARYASGSLEVDVLAIVFERQEQDRELINVNNRLVRANWNELDETVYALDDGSGASVRLRTLQNGDRQRKLVYWYVIGGIPTSSPVIAKLLEVYGAFRGDTRAMLVGVSVPDPGGMSREAILAAVSPFYAWSTGRMP